MTEHNYREAEKDITERHHVEETLKFVAQRGWKGCNESFLVALTQYLAQLFQVDYVIIDKVGTPPTQAETVALYVKGAIVPNMQYDLKNTPCADVMNGKLCCYPERVQQLFPEDSLLVEMQIESYAGIPLWNTAGNVVGLIAVLDSKPLKDTAFISSILQLVATSVAAELERQYSEQALLDSRHFLEQIINTIADPVFVKDRQHRWILLNQAFCEYIGYPLEHLLGKSDYDIYLPQEADVFWEKDEIVFSMGAENINEETATNADGICRTILTKKSGYTDSTGQQFLVGIITDITEHKRMENELVTREREFRTLAENVPGILIRYDEKCRIRYINQKLMEDCDEHNRPKIGQTLIQLYPNDPLFAELHEIIKNVIETGQPTEIERYFPNHQGGGTWIFHYVAESDDNGKIIGALALGQDISERKKMEDELAARERELRILVETSPAPIFRYDTNCRRIYVNSTVEKITGKTAAELLNRVPSDASVLSKSEGQKLESVLQQVIQTGQATEGEIECVVASGETRHYCNRYAPELDADGNVISIILVALDITERKQAEQLLYQREQEFRTLVDNLPTTVLRYNRHLQRIYANPAYLQIMGGSEAELLNKSLEETWIATNVSVASYKAILTKVMRDGEKAEVLLEWTNRKGELISHVLKIVPEYTLDGQIQSALVLGFDFSEQRRQQLIETNRQQVFEKMARNNNLDTILEQVALYVESAKLGSYCAILLFDENKNHLQLFAAPSFPDSYCAKSSALTLEEKSQPCLGWARAALCKERVIIENLHEHPCALLCQDFIQEINAVARWSEPIISSHNQLLGVVSLCLNSADQPDENDLALLQKAAHLSAIAIERKRIEQQMQHQASYDALTGLPNRRMFHDRLQEEISKAERKGHQLALLFIDLDHFKDVNDTLGHQIGDNLLVHAAQRIQSCVRQSDTVARLGGDEFVVILPELDKVPPVERIAEAIIRAMTQPFKLGEYHTYVSASVGIAMYPQDAHHAETLVSYADQAMYAAKEAGRNSFNFFTRSMQEQAQRRLYLVNSLRDALEKNQLEVYYQPIIEVSTGKAVKAEALLRWHHPVLGMVSPAVFIPLAEETDLIQGWVERSDLKSA